MFNKFMTTATLIIFVCLVGCATKKTKPQTTHREIKKNSSIKPLTPTTVTVSAPLPNTLTLSENVPDEIKQELLADLEHLRQIHGEPASTLHRDVFGPLGETVNGEAYYQFFLQRVSHIDIHPSKKDFFVTAGGGTNPGTLFVSPEYIKYRKAMPPFERLAVLLHEARHNEKDNHWVHVICPKPFLGLDGKPIVAPWGQALSGKYACDKEAMGSYGITYIMAKNINKFCTNCSVQEKGEAGAYADSILLRITDTANREKLSKDK